MAPLDGGASAPVAPAGGTGGWYTGEEPRGASPAGAGKAAWGGEPGGAGGKGLWAVAGDAGLTAPTS